MTYKLEFHEKALKEFRALDKAVKERLKRKLEERLEQPHATASRLRGQKNRYKIKLMNPGIRLVYEVLDDRLVVYVLAVDKRERGRVYKRAHGRRR